MWITIAKYLHWFYLKFKITYCKASCLNILCAFSYMYNRELFATLVSSKVNERDSYYFDTNYVSWYVSDCVTKPCLGNLNHIIAVASTFGTEISGSIATCCL